MTQNLIMKMLTTYLDSAKMAIYLESTMKLAEEDLWIGDSGASSHMMGSEEHVFNKKLISGSMRTSNGAHMKMLCALRVKVISGMNRGFSASQKQCWVVGPSKVTKQNKESFHSSDP